MGNKRMHFMYVDESGDPGLVLPGMPIGRQPSRHYIVSGFVIAADEWREYLQQMVDIRRQMKAKYGLNVRAELHGSSIINPREDSVFRLIGSRKRRVNLYRDVLGLVVHKMPNAITISVNLDKHEPKYSSTASTNDIQYLTWQRLIQRYNTYLQKSCKGDLGMVFADETNEVKIRSMLRKMRVHNPVPSHFGGTYQATVDNIVEDPVMRKSHHAYFVQIADLICYALFRKIYRKGSYRRYNVDRLFDILDPLCLKEASREDPHGIVRL